MVKIIKWTAFLLFLVIMGRLGFVLVSSTGLSEDYTPKNAEKCEAITIAPGTEDLTIDHARGQVFISTDDRRNKVNNPVNGIYMIMVDDPSAVRKVSIDAPEDFHPHGISLWEGEGDLRKLFVVSHRLNGDHVIELFDVKVDGILAHEKTIADPLIHSPNDLVATGASSFYVTNDHGYQGKMKIFEDYLALPVSNVVHYKDGQASIAIDGLSYANGINMSKDGQTLYVAEIMKRHIKAWHKQADGSFKGGQAWSMRMAADNIEWDDQGRMWTAGHPNALAFLAHAKDANSLAPSMVSNVDIDANIISEVLITDGSAINAASVASASKGRYFVGAVFDSHILSCSLN